MLMHRVMAEGRTMATAFPPRGYASTGSILCLDGPGIDAAALETVSGHPTASPS
jgi:hypothetical protein